MHTEKDTQVFRYRYDYASMLLRDFITDRYGSYHYQGWVDEIYPSRVTLNGSPVNDQTIIQEGDWLEYLHKREDEESLSFDLQILYEDEFLIAISKPDNLPVSPSGGYFFNSMAIRVKEFYGDRDISPIHRLDLETSGVLLFGKGRRARGKLQPLFEKKKVEKFYQSITFESPQVNLIEGNMVPAKNSKIYTKFALESSESPTSKTLIDLVKPWGNYHRVWLRPITGKTNQIRVHLAGVNCPIVGDKKYYPDEQVYLDWIINRDINPLLPKLILPRQALHCERVAFFNPLTQSEFSISDSSPHWEEKIAPLLN